MLLIAMSPGPLMETCMEASSPGPNSKTVLVWPRPMVEPVLEADPPFPVDVPKTRAFSGGEATGAGTTISLPLAVAPGATVTVVGGFTAPVPGGAGGGVGVVGGGVLLAPPPQPTAMVKSTSRIKRWSKAHHPVFRYVLKRCFQQNRCCTSGK